MLEATFDYKGFLVPGVGKRLLGAAIKAAYQAPGELWHAEFRDDHFTNAGATKYGYTPRSGDPGTPGAANFKRSYQGRKLKVLGHTRPLESTGVSRERARRVDIRATSKRGRIVLHTPGLNRKNPYTQINMREELTRVLPQEADAMWKSFDERLGEEVKNIQATRRNKVT